MVPDSPKRQSSATGNVRGGRESFLERHFEQPSEGLRGWSAVDHDRHKKLDPLVVKRIEEADFFALIHRRLP
jgi:hypothetical protein